MENFILKAKEKFSHFDYTNTVYTSKKVNILCNSHGEFLIDPYHFLSSKYGCPACGREATRVPYEVALQRCIDKHGDTYVYGDTFRDSYKGIHKKATITCKVHGTFSQVVKSHYLGSNCPNCARRLPVDEVIQRAQQIHGRYVYDDIFRESYTKAKGYASILCPLHGRFTQWVSNHLQGRGCPVCASEITVSLRRSWSA